MADMTKDKAADLSTWLNDTFTKPRKLSKISEKSRTMGSCHIDTKKYSNIFEQVIKK